MKPLNDYVPIDHALKVEIGQLKRELQRLKSRNSRLESMLKSRDQAIADFKKWQQRMADYKYKYWLGEALNKFGITLDKDTKELVDIVRKRLQDEETWKSKYKQVRQAFDSLISKRHAADNI